MFDVDLATWEEYEYEFMKLLLKKWVVGIHKPPKEKRKDRDIKVDYEDWTSKTFEVKNCPKALEYGSIVFESECNGKPSWIFVSKADYVVYRIWDERYRQDRWKLLHELVWINKCETMGWDNEKAKMYVVQNEIAKLIFNKL